MCYYEVETFEITSHAHLPNSISVPQHINSPPPNQVLFPVRNLVYPHLYLRRHQHNHLNYQVLNRRTCPHKVQVSVRPRCLHYSQATLRHPFRQICHLLVLCLRSSQACILLCPLPRQQLQANHRYGQVCQPVQAPPITQPRCVIINLQYL